MFYVPADRDSTATTNFSKWEQAFRVYSNIYTRTYPTKSTELIQYNHVGVVTVSPITAQAAQKKSVADSTRESNTCKYDHRCKECSKFNHGKHVCRKRKRQQGAATTSGNITTQAPMQETNK